MTSALDTPVIDADSHVTEPPDLWTSRMPARWADCAPRVIRDEATGRDKWWIGDVPTAEVGTNAMAGWTDFFPNTPPTLDQIDPAAYEPGPRLQRLDEYGVHAQVLYPNILGFNSHAIATLDDPAMQLSCIASYNDFIAEFASEDPERLIPLACLPFWNIEESVAEMDRAEQLGHKGIIFGFDFAKVGLPPLRSMHWDPVFRAAQERGLSINFHIGFSAALTTEEVKAIRAQERADYAKDAALFMLGNATVISEIIMGGICDRYPDLRFVSVESGYGFIPYLLESLDWQFKNMGVGLDHPTWLLPSDYFRRQIYTTFWFEYQSLELLRLYPDNVMFETDFPHPTSLSPGPASTALSARETIKANLAGIPDDIVVRVLNTTAAKLYGLQPAT